MDVMSKWVFGTLFTALVLWVCEGTCSGGKGSGNKGARRHNPSSPHSHRPHSTTPRTNKRGQVGQDWQGRSERFNKGVSFLPPCYTGGGVAGTHTLPSALHACCQNRSLPYFLGPFHHCCLLCVSSAASSSGLGVGVVVVLTVGSVVSSIALTFFNQVSHTHRYHIYTHIYIGRYR